MVSSPFGRGSCGRRWSSLVLRCSVGVEVDFACIVEARVDVVCVDSPRVSFVPDVRSHGMEGGLYQVFGVGEAVRVEAVKIRVFGCVVDGLVGEALGDHLMPSLSRYLRIADSSTFLMGRLSSRAMSVSARA